MSKHNNYNKYRDNSRINFNSTEGDAVTKAIIAKVDDDRKTREALIANAEAEVEEEVVDTAVEEIVEEPAVEVVEELPTIEGDGNEPLVGTTTTRLNIRSNPAVGDNVVTVVNEGTVVMIDYPVADGDWFKVYTEAGVEGYCMKKFVKISE